VIVDDVELEQSNEGQYFLICSESQPPRLMKYVGCKYGDHNFTPMKMDKFGKSELSQLAEIFSV